MAKIIVGIGGGIAAFKALDLVRQLIKSGHEVRVVMTQAATHFVGPVTFTGITGAPAVTDLWDPEAAGEKHVELTAWAELMVIAPATANLIARAAHGLADDAVLATIACADIPIAFAPAMHTRMWQQKATQENVAKLEARGWLRIGPVRGALASGDIGLGRMCEPEDIEQALCALLDNKRRDSEIKPLRGQRVVVSAGPTQEPLDPVRFLTNHSSGKMGYAIAAAANKRGADVVLVTGPTQLEPPPGVEVVSIVTALEMHAAVIAERERAAAFVMTAAVSDYRPEQTHSQKLKKTAGPMTLNLVRNPDILAELGAQASRTYRLVGFALETEDVVAHAQDKRSRKNCDLVVANHANNAFGGDDNEVWFVEANRVRELERQPKSAIAERVVDWLVQSLATN